MKFETYRTVILPTHCAKCGRELTDEVSIAHGLGPTCRKRVYAQVCNDDKAEVNELVIKIAVDQGATEETRRAILAIINLGYEGVARYIAKKYSKIQVYYHNGFMYFKLPFNEDMNFAMRSFGRFQTEAPLDTIPGKVWRVHESFSLRFYTLLLTYYKGVFIYGRRGLQEIGGKPIK